MKGQWCKIDKNKFCQEMNCQGCGINFFGEGWADYQLVSDEAVLYSVSVGRQNILTNISINTVNTLTNLSC